MSWKDIENKHKQLTDELIHTSDNETEIKMRVISQFLIAPRFINLTDSGVLKKIDLTNPKHTEPLLTKINAWVGDIKKEYKNKHDQLIDQEFENFKNLLLK